MTQRQRPRPPSVTMRGHGGRAASRCRAAGAVSPYLGETTRPGFRRGESASNRSETVSRRAPRHSPSMWIPERGNETCWWARPRRLLIAAGCRGTMRAA